MFMSTDLTDLDILESVADRVVEHKSEVIVAIRMVQQSQLQLNVLADYTANINIGFTLLFLVYLQDARQLIASFSWCWLKTLIPCCLSNAVVTPLAAIGWRLKLPS
jgi:hypothetical protein